MTRFGWVITTYVATLAATLSAFLHPLPKLIWNASASVPIGLYTVHPAGTLQVAELVVVRPPDALASFLDERHYLPKGVTMLKRVLALPGQTVCRTDHAIAVDGSQWATRSTAIEAVGRFPSGKAANAFPSVRSSS